MQIRLFCSNCAFSSSPLSPSSRKDWDCQKAQGNFKEAARSLFCMGPTFNYSFLKWGSLGNFTNCFQSIFFTLTKYIHPSARCLIANLHWSHFHIEFSSSIFLSILDVLAFIYVANSTDNPQIKMTSQITWKLTF